MNQYKIGFKISEGCSYLKWDTDQICRHLHSLGYTAVEWITESLNPYEMSLNEIKNVIKTSEDHGLEVSEIVVQRDLVSLNEEERKRNIQYVLKCIETYAEAGVKVINLFTGPRPWIENPVITGRDLSEGDAWNMVFEAYDQFVLAAERYGIKLAVEGVWGHLCHDFFTTQFLVNHYNSSALGVNYDPSHDILCGNMDVAWAIRMWGKDRIKHVHLKDAVGWYLKDMAGNMKDGRFVFPLLGEGKVEWQAFIYALNEIGYDGAMVVEFESFDYLRNILGGSMQKAAEISMDNVRTLFG